MLGSRRQSDPGLPVNVAGGGRVIRMSCAWRSCLAPVSYLGLMRRILCPHRRRTESRLAEADLIFPDPLIRPVASPGPGISGACHGELVEDGLVSDQPAERQRWQPLAAVAARRLVTTFGGPCGLNARCQSKPALEPTRKPVRTRAVAPDATRLFCRGQHDSPRPAQ